MFEKRSDTETTEKYRLDVSTLLELTVPRECIEGIEVNCELLRMHARKVEAFEIPDEVVEEIDE